MIDCRIYKDQAKVRQQKECHLDPEGHRNVVDVVQQVAPMVALAGAAAEEESRPPPPRRYIPLPPPPAVASFVGTNDLECRFESYERHHFDKSDAQGPPWYLMGAESVGIEDDGDREYR